MANLSRRDFMKYAGALSAGVLGASALTAESTSQPNVILILMDDMGWADTHCYGSTYHETPNIDRLAQQGIRFTNAYAACPVCSPTRASILTGKYPARLHLTDWIPGHFMPKAKYLPPKFNLELPLAETTIAEALKPAGYRSASIGKWHLGDTGFLPENQGFDLNFGGTKAGQPKSYFFPYESPDIKEGKQGEYLTDRLTDEAINFIKHNEENPFFLYFPHYAVHQKIMAKEEMIDHFKSTIKPGQPQNNPVYAAMIQSVDESVGRIMATLDELHLADNTMIIFTSDNGGLMGTTSNAPLRDGKGTLYEGGIREPLIIRWPGHIQPGITSNTPVISTDFYPTILSMAGVPCTDPTIDGLNLLPLLCEGKAPDRDTFYWHYPHYHPKGATPAGIVRKGNMKLIEYYGENRFELFNLQTDPYETTNLADTQPATTKELSNCLHDWLKKVEAQMPTQNPDYDPKNPEAGS